MPLFRRVVGVAALALLGAGAATAAPRVERDIPYAFGSQASLKRQSFDLYLPQTAGRPPLVVFVHGGFWVESDDLYRIGERIAHALVADGVAVALARYRLAPAVRHPTQVRDVAAAVAVLKQAADRYGYDARKIYLMGHSAGATIAAQLLLDAAHLRDVGLKPADIAGAVLLSGIYDFGPTGPMAAQHADIVRAVFGPPAAARATAPITHVRAAPPLLVLAAEKDFPGFAADARRFVRAMRAAGHKQVQETIIPAADHFTLTDLSRHRLVRALVGAFVGATGLDAQTAALMRLRQDWHAPPFSTEAFWKAGVPVHSYAVDKRLRASLEQIYEQNFYELRAYPLERYHAIDLYDYLQRLPAAKAGRGDYLIVTNVRGERLYYTRAQLAAHRPRLVIGLDDERNLFRLNVFYQNRREYSWRHDAPPIMARSLGAFIHFPSEPPADVRPSTRAALSLSPASFRFVESDPWRALVGVPPELRAVLTESNACLSCHSFRGAGARAGHIAAATGKLHGGFALAFEEYPAEALRRFLFDPHASARLIGVRANPVEGGLGPELHDFLAAERRTVSPATE